MAAYAGGCDGSSVTADGMLISSSRKISVRQECAKRLDFRRYEIGECPNSGSVLHIAVHEEVIGNNQPDIVYHPHKLTAVTLPMWHCRKPGAGFDCKHHALPMFASCSDSGMRRHRPHPSRRWIIRYCTIAGDNKMAVQVFHITRPTIPFHIGTAGIHSPGRIRNLPAYESFIPRFTESDRDVGLSFRQVNIPLADDQLDPQSRITGMKCIDERCLSEARRQARSAGHPNGAGEPLVARSEVTLEGGHRCLHALGGRPQFLSKFSQSIAAKVAFD